MLFTNYFMKLSGEDPVIIRTCHRYIRRIFILIGFNVLFVFCICGAAATILIFHIMQELYFASIVGGIVWALLVTNIYLLVLYTLTPLLLPIGKKGSPSVKLGKDRIAWRVLFSVSFILRVVFMGLLGFISIQPLVLLIFQPEGIPTQFIITGIKTVYAAGFKPKVLSAIGTAIFLIPVFLKLAVRGIGRKTFRIDASDISTPKLLEELYGQVQTWGFQDQADFDSFRSVVLRIKPDRLRTNAFYFQKALFEVKFILSRYEKFKQNYSQALSSKVQEIMKREPGSGPNSEQLPISHLRNFEGLSKMDSIGDSYHYFEYWADPPFRTIKKVLSPANMPKGTTEDLIDEILGSV